MDFNLKQPITTNKQNVLDVEILIGLEINLTGYLSLDIYSLMGTYPLSTTTKNKAL